MFGEYIPFGEWFPLLYKFTPMASGLARGSEFSSFEAGDLRFSQAFVLKAQCRISFAGKPTPWRKVAKSPMFSSIPPTTVGSTALNS